MIKKPHITILGALSLFATLHAQESALIDGAPKPYQLVEASFEKGLKDQAIHVTGNEGYAEIQDTAALAQPPSFTFEALVKLGPLSKNQNMLAVRRDKINDWQIFTDPAGKVVVVGYGKGNSVVLQVSTTDKLTPNEWCHVCVSVDESQTAHIYFDGDEVVEKALTGELNASSVPIRIGGAGIAGRILSGLIEDVRIYSGPVSADRLAEIKKEIGHSWTPDGADVQPTPPASPPVSPAQMAAAFDFETPGAWSTAPLEFQESDWQELANYDRGVGKKDWPVPKVTREDVANGVTLSTAHVKHGKFAGEWRNHPRYPTIACGLVTPDWSGDQAIRFSAYSEAATGEIITLGVRSDAASTPSLDYFVHDFPVDWTGWKEITIPFSQFHALGAPSGWNHVQGLYFFTKFARRSPDPSTALFLDNIELLPSPGKAPALVATPSPAPPPGGGVLFTVGYSHDAPVPLNHDGPELAADAPKAAPLVQSPFFQGVRAHRSYWPRYDPGDAYFDPHGHVYLRSPGVIETLDSDQHWLKHDLAPAIKDFARSQGWQGISLAWGGDPTVRFDADGDVYALEDVKHIDVDGKETSATDRVALLLHSHDHGATWKAIALPGRMADFEKIDGHNADALKHPPVIVLSDARYFAWAEQDGYLLLPEKKADGSLFLPPKIRFGKDVLTGPVHSGAGNFVLTQGDKIFIVYGSYPQPPALGPLLTGRVETRDAWEKSLPPIPADHPARRMQYPYRTGKRTMSAAGGVPTFVVAYDRKTKHLSDPVFVGYGGPILDAHNWAAITADSKGILHVVINGHIDPLMYTSSLRPGDITAWSSPVYIPREPGSPKLSYVSYASLTCDKDDNLICVVRSDSGDYNHRLAVMRKPAGQPWEKEQSLVVPFAGGYHVWTDKVGYDPLRNRLFVGYYDQSMQIEFSRADYLFYRFYWPDDEHELVAGVGKPGNVLNPGLPVGKKTAIYTPGPCEAVVMFSSDSGRTWNVATTRDFEPAPNRQLAKP